MFMASPVISADEPAIGDSYEGGFFAGYISHTANSVPTHRLIVAPKSTGETSDTAQDSATSLSGFSDYDGAVNTAIFLAAGNSDAADFVDGLTIGGYSDWYWPTLVELQIAYFFLKPTTTTSFCNRGTNAYQVPERTTDWNCSASPAADPAQTTVSAFQAGGGEDFNTNYHWSSYGIVSNNRNVRIRFSDGRSNGESRTASRVIRAFRKNSV
jgi:hypothetical protein